MCVRENERERNEKDGKRWDWNMHKKALSSIILNDTIQISLLKDSVDLQGFFFLKKRGYLNLYRAWGVRHWVWLKIERKGHFSCMEIYHKIIILWEGETETYTQPVRRLTKPLGSLLSPPPLTHSQDNWEYPHSQNTVTQISTTSQQQQQQQGTVSLCWPEMYT